MAAGFRAHRPAVRELRVSHSHACLNLFAGTSLGTVDTLDQFSRSKRYYLNPP